jgi:hypothetical protein
VTPSNRSPLTITRLLVAGIIIATGIAPAAAQEWGRPAIPRNGVCFYEHENYGGRFFCAPAGSESKQVPAEANDEISSIQFFGSAEVTVYRDISFRGASRQITEDVPNLRRIGWNDRISSFRVASTRAGASLNRPVWGRPSRPANGACFYQDPGYSGRYFCARTGERAPDVPRGTNDKISSIQLFGDAEVIVYKDALYSGASERFDFDMRDLRQAGWNDRISSFAVVTRSTRAPVRRNVSRAEATEIVRRAYLNVLKREPDPGAAGYIEAVMKDAWSQAKVESELKKSEEYKRIRK